MVVSTSFQWLYGVINYADFLCGIVFRCKANDTENSVNYIKCQNVAHLLLDK